MKIDCFTASPALKPKEPRKVIAPNPPVESLLKDIGDMLDEIRGDGFIPVDILLGKETHALLSSEIRNHYQTKGYRDPSINTFAGVELTAKPENDTHLRITCKYPEDAVSAEKPQPPAAPATKSQGKSYKMTPPDRTTSIEPATFT